MSNPIEAIAILMVAGVPNEYGRAHRAEDLKQLAEKYPEKLFFKDDTLYTRLQLEDDQHLFRWSVSIGHHVEQQHVDQKRLALSEMLNAFSKLKEELRYHNAVTGKLLLLADHEHDALRKLRNELTKILEDQYLWAGLQDT